MKKRKPMDSTPTHVGPVETGVPMPRSKNFGGLREKMEEMLPGQSFVTNMSSSACYKMAQSLGMFVRVRKDGSQLRVWRVMSEEAKRDSHAAKTKHGSTLPGR